MRGNQQLWMLSKLVISIYNTQSYQALKAKFNGLKYFKTLSGLERKAADSSKMLPHFLRAMHCSRSLPCPAGNRAKRETPQACNAEE